MSFFLSHLHLLINAVLTFLIDLLFLALCLAGYGGYGGLNQEIILNFSQMIIRHSEHQKMEIRYDFHENESSFIQVKFFQELPENK